MTWRAIFARPYKKVTSGRDAAEEAAAAKSAPEYGFDKKRVGIHVQFCAEALKGAAPHLEAAEREVWTDG